MSITEQCEQEWGLVYFRKKAQFNQYTQFKSKSYAYQKVLGKLHFLSQQQDQTNTKQIKLYIQSLNTILQQLKNIFSQLFQQLKFLKLQSLSGLIEGFQQLISTMHHYTVQGAKNKLEYNKRKPDDDENYETCNKCLGSINKINIKKLYEEITTTSTLDTESQTMTKEERRKMINQLDQYDVVLAEKENYLRKVNTVLENKGKVGMISNHDKTYNFLSEYLSKIQKIQERRAKSYNKTKTSQIEPENNWEQQSYKHILEYIKRVLFEHFVNQCSGPVKKIFEKLDFDKIFRSYEDHAGANGYETKSKAMLNAETQTLDIPEVEQLRMIERRMQSKLKENSLLKTNKQQLEKKYFESLDLTRKAQIQLMDTKKRTKWLQTQVKTLEQNLKILTQSFNQNKVNYEQQKNKTFESHINERQKIIRASKMIEMQLKTLTVQHSKCDAVKKKMSKGKGAVIDGQTQTEQNDEETESHMFAKTDSFPLKRRKSALNKMMFTSFKAERKNGAFMKPLEGGIPLIDPSQQDQQTIEEDERQNSCRENLRLELQSNIMSLTIIPSDLTEIKSLQKKPTSKATNSTKKPNYKMNKTGYIEKFKDPDEKNINELLQTYEQERNLPAVGKRIKMSMADFKRLKTQQSNTQQSSYFNKKYKFSNFNRFTQMDQDNGNQSISQQKEGKDVRQSSSKSREKSYFQVSQRLYKKEKKEIIDPQFQRVIENRKEKFYIKKISRESINYKVEKQRIKEISQILKPYVYNNNNVLKRKSSRMNLKSIRQRLSEFSQSSRRQSMIRNPTQAIQPQLQQQNIITRRNSLQKSRRASRQTTKPQFKRNVGRQIIDVQQIIQTQYAYLKAVGFVDFIMKIGKESKKMVKAMHKIQNDVKNKFQAPSQLDLALFGGKDEAQDYIKSRNFWTIDNLKENMMIYNKNDGLSTKIQKYFNLLKRANPQLYGVLVRFLVNPIFAVYGNNNKTNKMSQHEIMADEDPYFVKQLFNQLQKYHKIRHNECTHIVDFLQKIGFYRYTYF